MRRSQSWKKSSVWLWGALCVGMLWGCQRAHSLGAQMDGSEPAGKFVNWPTQAKSGGSSMFWKHWGDGRAELASYETTISRYGELRPAELVMIFVTEPMDRRTWIKDDAAPESQKVQVLKLNQSLKFRTGLYPYSVLTSVFAPVGSWRGPAFSPAKITLSAQEWCGHVFEGLWVGPSRMLTQVRSYFASEGEKNHVQKIPATTLFEDALWIQLRELDGPFLQGKSWRGKLVPSLWRIRKQHTPTQVVDAEISREKTSRENKPIHRFTLRYGGYWKRIDVEQAWPHQILGWEASDGERAKRQGIKRLPYWSLHNRGDGRYRKEIGLK
ncbi:MAG: hypothetical protein H6728_14585 [Myxococcales bacterium]|nr:hypothetical protein [Myxococcales bacterium]MCB9644296.1 hypothetical protein [Myxococcales bacterium]